MADSKSKEKIQKLQAEIKHLRKKLTKLTPPLEVLLKHRGFTEGSGYTKKNSFR